MDEIKANQILVNQIAIMTMLLLLGKQKFAKYDELFGYGLNEGVQNLISLSEKLVANGAEHATRG